MKIQTLCIIGVTILLADAKYLEPEKQQQIDAIAEAILGCRTILGMQLSVVHKGEMVYAKGYGVIDKDNEQPVTPKTLFAIASVSKHISATLTGMILEENGLSWNTKVRDIIGEDFYFYDGLRTSQATLKDLASHRLGIPRRDYISFKEDFSRADYATDFRFVRPLETFRDTQLYNNNMFHMLAYITELVSGQTWEELIVERLFKPANMTSTTMYHVMDLSRDDIARPYSNDRPFGPLVRLNDDYNIYNTRGGAAGEIVINAEDMAQWLKLQTDGGRLNGVQVIPEKVVREVQTAVSFWPLPTDIFDYPNLPISYVSVGYGLGIQTSFYRGYRMLEHNGALPGYNSMLTILPAMELGIHVSLNGIDSFDLGRLNLQAFTLDIMLGYEPWLNTTTVCTFPAPWIPLPPFPRSSQKMSPFGDDTSQHYVKKPNANSAVPYPTDLTPYVGQYGDFFYGNVTVFADESGSKLFLDYELFEPWELIPTEEENVFFGQSAPFSWPMHLPEVIFTKSDGLQQFDRVQVPIDTSDPTLFVRGLKKSDAPPPPNPNDCS